MKSSVVIASIGRKSLVETIKSINNGSHVPDQIICVLPNIKFNFYKNLKSKNVKIVYCKKKNQIIQRNKGLSFVKNRYIFQIDDDVKVSKHCLKRMLNAYMKLKKNSVALGPIFFDLKNKLHYNYKNESFLSNIYKYLICSAPLSNKKSGKITSLGVAYAADFYSSENFIKSDFLPGGCVMYTKLGITRIKELDGYDKSYCEDILHSIERKKKGIQHYVIKNAKVFTEKNLNNRLILNEYFKEIFIRKKICKILGGNIIRFYIWSFFEFFNRFIRSIT